MSHQITISDGAYATIPALANELGRSPEALAEEAIQTWQAKLLDQQAFWGDIAE